MPLLLAIFTLLTLAACTAAEPTPIVTPEPGNPQRGEALFAQQVIGRNFAVGCIACHSLQPGFDLVGPAIPGVATRAQTAVPGQTAEEYLRLAIIDPNDYIVPGYRANSMYLNYGTDLTAQEIEDLVAYMLTLE